MLDGDGFPDDVSERFKAFLLRGFYGDHVKRYSKRPIYWLFSSSDGSILLLPISITISHLGQYQI